MTLALSSQAAALDRRRKAAIVVQCLLAEGQSPPLAGLPEDAQVELTRELGQLRLVDRDTLHAVVSEFADHLEAVGLTAPRGAEAAAAALSGHISPAAAARIKAEGSQPPGAGAWGAVVALPPPALVEPLTRESVEVSAVVLSKLPVAKAAEVLGLLPGERARRVTYAVSQTAGIRPEAVRRIGEALAAEYCAAPPRAFGLPPGERVGAILNSSREATREALLGGLAAEDEAFAAQVRRAIFTFRHLPQRLRAADVPRVLRAVDAQTVAAALASARAAGGEDAQAADFVLSSVSQRMADGLREEMEGLGEVKAKAGEAAQAALIAAIRERAAAGEVSLIDPEEAEGG